MVYAVKSSTASARKVSVNSDTSETLKNGYHVGFEPETTDTGPEKIPFFSKIRGQFAPLSGDNPDRGVRLPTFFHLFLKKCPFPFDRLPKNFEYKVWKSSSRGTRGPGLFFGKTQIFTERLPKKPE